MRLRLRPRALLAPIPVLILASSLGISSAVGRESTLRFQTVEIRADGVYPATLHLKAGWDVPGWHNSDTVAHTVTFLNGLCTFQVTAHQGGHCDIAFWFAVGRYSYIVTGDDAFFRGAVVVEPRKRSVTLTASPRRIKRGGRVLLSGIAYAEPPLTVGSPPNRSSSSVAIVAGTWFALRA